MASQRGAVAAAAAVPFAASRIIRRWCRWMQMTRALRQEITHAAQRRTVHKADARHARESWLI